MNPVFLVLIAGAVITAAWTGTMPAVMKATFESAKGAVEVAFGLLGPMVLFLGMIQVLRDAGAVGAVARALAPVMRRLFPDVPPDHPAMGAMIMNVAANVFGLGNAATPFGLKAMQELNRLNPHPGVATNAMVLFLAINTSGVAVFPSGVIAIRDALGSQNPGGIVLPSILATLCSTLVGLAVAIWLSKRPAYAVERHVEAATGPATTSTLGDGIRQADASELLVENRSGTSPGRVRAAWAAAAVLLGGLLHEAWRMVAGVDLCLPVVDVLRGGMAALGAVPAAGPLHAPPEELLSVGEFVSEQVLGQWLIPLFLTFIVVFSWARGVKVYESAVQGAREGFQIFVMIVPFLTLILVAVGVFRASGALESLQALLQPATSLIGFPAEALPMALIRPLSGGGAMGVMTSTMEAYGPDSLVGYLVSVMNGSTETTFYVLAVYFGCVQIRAVRHAVVACLAADATGMLAALTFTRLLLV